MEILDGLKILLINHRIEYEASPFEKPHINNHDLTIVTKGTLYYTVDGESIVVNEGDAVYCPAGVTLCRDKSSIASYLSFNFTTKRN